MAQETTNLIQVVNNWLDKTFSPRGKKLFLVTIVVLIAAVAYLAVSFAHSGKQDNGDLDIIEEGVDQLVNGGQNTEIDIEIEPIDDNMVSIPVEELGRANPFLPEGESAIVTRNTNLYGEQLMAPPDYLHEGSDASKVMTTKVSGILYDTVKPSAILNIEGRDYLVRIGDIVNNYKVLSITKDLVTVELNKNTYKAGVGQLMTEISLNHNVIYDLPNRFGGAKK